jgi:hypothetical protein
LSSYGGVVEDSNYVGCDTVVTLFRLKSSDDSGEEENGNKDLQKAEKEFLVNAVAFEIVTYGSRY